MQYYAAFVGLILAVVVPQAYAQQNPDDQYIAIYSLMQQADSLVVSGQPREALADYTQARADLDKFAKIFPNWNDTIVNYRLNYLAQKISGLTAQLGNEHAAAGCHGKVPGSTPPGAELRAQLDTLQSQVRNLQADNQTLQAKLQEALRAQPAAADTGDLAKVQSQVLLLMKQYDLLKAASAQTKMGKGSGAANLGALKKARQALADANKNLAVQTKRADKLAKDNQALQADHNTIEALRAEIVLLKKQAAGLPAGAAQPMP